MKDNFDDIVKRKWDHLQFPVDENHRTDMIQLLDQQKRRRGVFFWWLGGLLVAIVAGSMLLISPDQGKKLRSNVSNVQLDTSEVNTSASSASQTIKTIADQSNANQPNSIEFKTQDETNVSEEALLNPHVASASNTSLTDPVTSEKQTRQEKPVEIIKLNDSLKSARQEPT